MNDRRLSFVCPCGHWDRDLGAFLDHAFACHARRSLTVGIATGVVSGGYDLPPVRRYPRFRNTQGWRVGHYQSRMLGFPLSPPGAREEGGTYSPDRV